jgi:cytochrome P450
MSAVAPQPVRFPLLLLLDDMRTDRAAEGPWPPGELSFSMARTRRFEHDPLGLLVSGYERYGQVFTLKIFHHNAVYMLTIDGAYHRTHRRLMLPAFHRERIAAATTVMREEVERALVELVPDTVVNLYDWTRRVALRVALRALFGFDPDVAEAGGLNAAGEFESALSFYGRDYLLQMLRGPGTPFARMIASRRRLDGLIYGEIERRRATGERGEDILSLLLDASDEDGASLDDRQVRDEVMTLLFAGHDTTTSTVAFMFYELARNPELLDDPEIDIEMIVDETLRKYPPAYIGPRRAVEAFEFNGVHVPARAHVHYCSWASHHLPDVFPEPAAFRPQRFSEENKAKLPRGAYVPFGGGSRTCIGMRFGQAEIAIIARTILERFRLELPPGFELEIRQAPTISPRQGLPMRVRAIA